jgi:hypothetical protein
VKEFPVIPGDFKRNYPSTGSSVLLPLRLNGTELPEPEVMVCGGAPNGAFNKSNYYRVFVSAANTCGRLSDRPEPTMGHGGNANATCHVGHVTFTDR